MSALSLPLPPPRSYVGDRFRPTSCPGEPLLDPSDGSPLGFQATTSEDELEQALRQATLCHQSQTWYGLGAARAEVLEALADRLEPHLEELAELEARQTGVLLRQTRALIGLLPLIFRGAAAQVRAHPDLTRHGAGGTIEIWRKPWGPALCLAPWNSPAPIAAHKLASAMAAGAPVILKPSEMTPYTAERLFEVIATLDLPRGAVQLVHGGSAEGARLVADARIKAVSFTGGLRGGQDIARAAARDLKPVQLELGGHNPLVILPGADLTAVLDGLMTGLTTLNGQWCRAVGQVYVPRTMEAELLEGFRSRIAALKLGPALNEGDEGSDMGPLIHRTHKDHLLLQVQRLVGLGGRRVGSWEDAGGCYLRPELITGVAAQDDRQELFGPLATVQVYREVAELVPRINASPYGLAAYLFGDDPDLLLPLARQLQVGSTKINGVTLTSLCPEAPRAAWGWSGLGEEGSFETFRFFQGTMVLGSATQRKGQD